MADQRGTDLTWGQLGEATYDAVEKKWSFLRQPVLPNLLQPIQPIKECLPAPSSTEQEETKDDDVREVTRKRKDWRTSKALQAFSDLGGAGSYLKTLERPQEEEKTTRSATGDVMAAGVAKLRSATNKGYRGFPVIAASYGEGGHVLRITKPRVEDHTWTNHTDDKIRLLYLERSEHGYWSAGAAAIEQVTFAIDTEGLQTWLAVRHAASTTIMRPMVHPFPVAQDVPRYMLNEYPPSRIDSNVACTITTQETRGRAHVDVAFNPWYTRQFAILDEAGYWKTWNIEGIHSGSKTAAKGKEGYIYDDPGLHDAAPKPEDAGWGRFIWVSDVGTIVVCNLRHVAMFAIGREVTKLNCPQVIHKGSSGRILGMKRSPVWHDKFFILTDTRLFLLDTMAAGCQIIMSTPHFREAQSADLKLELHGRDETCTALLYSSNTGLVNVYNFKLDTDAPTPVTWATDAFHLSKSDNGSPPKDVQGLCVLPASEPPERWNKNRDGRWYNPNQFYQAFILSKDLTISQTLLAEGDLVAGPTAEKPAIYEAVGAPDTGKLVPEKIKTAKGDEKVDELVAIVPDGLPEDAIQGPLRPNFWEMKAATKPEILVKKSDAINAQTWYELATAEWPFHCRPKQGQCRGHASPQAKPRDGQNLQEGDLVMQDYVEKIIDNIQRRKEVEQQGLTTMRDLSEFSKFTEDIDDGARYLGDFVSAFGDDDESSNMAINLRTCDVSSMLEAQGGKAAEGATTDMSKVYDKVVELYLASLPAETPGEVRIAKERMIRNIAADVFLSSLVVYVQEKPKIAETQSTDLAESFRSSQFTQSQAIGSQRSHLPSATLDPNLPSSQPSVDGGMVEQYSQLLTPDPSVAGSQMGESAEDPSITLLRSYALQVKTQKPLGKTRADILNTWELGSDINNFQWKAPDLNGTVEAEDEEGAEELQAKKEREARREHKERRKMEKEIRRQHRYSMLPQSQEIYSPNPSGPESQRKAKRKSLGAFGSQFSQSQTPGFGTPVAKKLSRKSMGAYPWQSQSQGGGWGGERGSQTPTVGVYAGTRIPRPGTNAGNSFGAASQGGASTPQIGISTGAASQGPGAGQSFGTSFVGQGGMPMTQPVQGAFGGRRSLGGRQSLGGPEKKRRKGF